MFSLLVIRHRRWICFAVFTAFLCGLLLAPRRLPAESPRVAVLEPLAELNTRTGITRQMFSPDGALLATFYVPFGGFMNTERRAGIDLIIWDVETGDAKVRIADGWLGFAFSSTGKALATWVDGKVQILDLQTGKRLATLVHDNVQNTRFVPRANLLVTETRNWKGMQPVPSELRFWSTRTWERVETEIDHCMPLTWPTVSPDGKYVAGFEPIAPGSKNKKSHLKLWEFETGQELPAPNAVPPVSMSQQRIGFTRSGKELVVWPRLWDIDAEAATLVPESFDFYQDVYLGLSDRWYGRHGRSRNKRAKIIDGEIIVWDLVKGEKIAQYVNPVPEPPINTNSLGPGATIPWVFEDALAFTSKDRSSGASMIDIWELADREIVRSISLDGPDPSVDGYPWRIDPKSPCVRVAKDGRTIIVLEAARNTKSYQERRCKVTAYVLETGERKYQLVGHNNFVSSICLSPNGQWIATASGSDQHWDRRYGEVQLFDMDSGQLVRTVIDQSRAVHCLAFDSQGEYLAIGRQIGGPRYSCEVGLWRTSTGTKVSNLQLPSLNGYSGGLDQPHSLAFSPDDRLLAVGESSRLSLWEMPSGKFRCIGDIGGPGTVQSLEFSGDGETLYFGIQHLDGTHHLEAVKVASLGNQQPRDVNREPFRPTDALVGGGEIVLSTQNRWIATCLPAWSAHAGEIAIWDVESKELRKVICHDGVRSMDFSSKGQMVTASIRPESNVTTVIDPKTGKKLVRLRHSGPVVLSPTGEMIATRKKVPRSAKLIRHRRGFLQVKRTPSIAGIDLWDTRTGRKLAELPHEGFRDLDFSPNGRFVASTGHGSTKLWQISHLVREPN